MRESGRWDGELDSKQTDRCRWMDGWMDRQIVRPYMYIRGYENRSKMPFTQRLRASLPGVSH